MREVEIELREMKWCLGRKKMEWGNVQLEEAGRRSGVKIKEEAE